MAKEDGWYRHLAGKDIVLLKGFLGPPDMDHSAGSRLRHVYWWEHAQLSKISTFKNIIIIDVLLQHLKARRARIPQFVNLLDSIATCDKWIGLLTSSDVREN
ncbi:MAG: hypothetical protein M1839_007046 [Geoglossum umbratile]|nr:MAG: hypothetical protein M1839_007046 [Geoglossum umbratile]